MIRCIQQSQVSLDPLAHLPRLKCIEEYRHNNRIIVRLKLGSGSERHNVTAHPPPFWTLSISLCLACIYNLYSRVVDC